MPRAMASTSHSETDLLRAHGAWIHALARRLVAVEHRAEDLAQETWLAALRHRGSPARALRPWLAGILSNLTRRDWRARARRERREQLAARESGRTSAGDTVEAAALGRDLADLVLGLREPLRTTILLRYYEDLPPREIALRMDVPVRTVNSRLARGLERLRSSLRRRDGSRAAWMPLGVAWMNAKQVVAIAAAIAVTVGALAWWRWPGPEPRKADAPAIASGSPLEEAPPGSTALTPPNPGTATDRSALPAPEADPEVAVAAAALRKIRGRVLDPDAIPLAGIEVMFHGGSSDPPPRAVSGIGGVFELEIQPTDGTVRVTDPRLVNVSVGVVRTGREVEPLVVVAPGHDLAGRVVDSSGAPLLGARVTLDPPPGFMRRFDVVLDSTLRFEAGSTTDASGSFALPGVPDLAGSRVVARLDGFADGSVEAPPGNDAGLRIEMSRSAAEADVLEGRVVDEERRPVPGARVSLGQRTAVTDSAGEFRLETVDAPDAAELVAVHPGHLPGRFTAERDAASGVPVWPASLVLRLGSKPLSLAGRVVDGEGQPRPGVRIWIDDPTRFGILGKDDVATVESILAADVASGDDFWRWCTTDGDGRFEWGGLLDRSYRLGMIDPHTIETARFGPFAAGERDLTIRFERAPARRIAGRVVTSRGDPVPGASLNLMARTFGGISTSLDTGIQVSDGEGRYAFEGVAGNELVVWVQGDDIVPTMLGVPSPGGDQEFDITVSVRCHLKVHLVGDASEADGLRVLDADGSELDLHEIAPGGVLREKRASLVDGRSAALGVVDSARTLSLLKGGGEVRRLEIWLAPGRLNVIEP